MSDNMGRYFVGLNCGLSADGIDAVVIEYDNSSGASEHKVLAFESMLLPDSLRRDILALAGGKQVPPAHIAKVQGQLASAAGVMCGNVIKSSGVDALFIEAIGWSGYPLGGNDGAVIELDGSDVIAQKFGTIVVSKFYSALPACGGLPMGLSAGLDWQRFHDEKLSRVLVHLGALAEVTFIPADSASCEVRVGIAGPGTAVIDELTFRYQHRIYDIDGSIAASGKVNQMLLSELKTDKFFSEDFPRYVSMEEYSPVYLLRLMNMAEKHDCGGADLIATVTELSAWCVCEAIGGFTQRPHEVILCGGGAKNIHLAGKIRQMLSPTSTYTTEKYNIGLTAKKAVDFAVLAAANIDGSIMMLPGATGASKAVLAGAMTGGCFDPE